MPGICYNQPLSAENELKNEKKRLIKIIDLLGRKTKTKNNEPLFYFYDDGSVEKRLTIH